jgi:hypothetical protein
MGRGRSGTGHPLPPGASSPLPAATRGWLALIIVLASSCPVALQAQEECVAAHADSQLLRMRGTLLDARQKLLVCAQSDCPKLISKDCTVWLTEVEASLSSVVFAVTDERGADLVDVEITANGRPLTERADGRATTLDPGAYEFRFRATGFTPLTLSVPIRASEKNRILRVSLTPVPPLAAPAVALEPTDESGGVSALTYVFGGVGLAGFAAFAGFGVAGLSKYASLERQCSPDCSPGDVAAGKRLYVLADVGLGVGIAGVAAAAISYFMQSSPREPAQVQARLEPALLDRGAYLSFTGRY